ncbi:24018_t:CDS:2, partial [Gigaspora rosea]
QPVFATLPPPGPIVGYVRPHISAELLSYGIGRKVFHRWKLAWQSDIQIGWSAGGTGWSSSGSPIVQPVINLATSLASSFGVTGSGPIISILIIWNGASTGIGCKGPHDL